MKQIVLHPHRDKRRLARALHAASWMAGIPWDDLHARDRHNFADNARRLMAALETDAEHNRVTP